METKQTASNSPKLIRSTTDESIIGNVAANVIDIADQITKDRAAFPLLVSAICQHALQLKGVGSRIMYGSAAWVEVLEEDTPAWVGFWDSKIHFWIQTEYAETVDLNLTVSSEIIHRMTQTQKSMYSPPLLWSREIPSFYRYRPEGVAELEISGRDLAWLEDAKKKLEETHRSQAVFPVEPMICSGRRVLDDDQSSFKHYDRALALKGFAKPPF